MKNKFIIIARVSIILVTIAILILAGYATFTKETPIAIPTPIAIFMIVSVLSALICSIIAFGLYVIKALKENTNRFLLSFMAEIAIFWIILVGYDYFFENGDMSVGKKMITAVLIMCASKSGEYIFSNHKHI